MIINRSQWGAAPPRGGTPRPLQVVDQGFIHYADVHESIPTASEANEAAICRAIQQYHFSRGYVDIAYEWMVGQTGDLYVGRDPHIEDASTCHNNRNGYGICVLTDGPISPAAQVGVVFAMNIGHLAYPNLKRTPLPHRAVCVTACPGDIITRWIQSTHW
jgi:hypothetical protein